MNPFRVMIILFCLCLPSAAVHGQGGGSVEGKVTFTGALVKAKPIDMAKEPACVKMHSAAPLLPENVVPGSNNTLQNVVVYISGGETDNTLDPSRPAAFDQRDCHYATHVLAVRIGQEIKISNSDPFAHNIHPIAKINREWNRMQLPNTPPFSYAYDKEEFIPVKCNIHSWMQGYIIVLRTSHFAVTGEDGRFSLPNLPAGHYVLTAWHESFGSQSQDIIVSGDGSKTIDFIFKVKP